MAHAKKQVKEDFAKLDLIEGYDAMFELLWYSQLPCFDVKNVTSTKDQQFGILKACSWKGVPVDCSEIFTMFPTDRGMCCSFNINDAEEMFKESAYRDNMEKLHDRDAELSFFKDRTGISPDLGDDKEPTSDAGKNKGLSVILDAHTDVVSASTITEDFQGFVAIIDGGSQFPLSTRKSVMLRPGYENLVAMSAVKVTAEEDIKTWEPEKRTCYFGDEYELLSHVNYTQVYFTNLLE